MIQLYRLLKIVFFCFQLIHLCLVEPRRYDKCSTRDGLEGVCVVKRYCRQSEPLQKCDDDGIVCCPIITTHRSAAPPPHAPAKDPRPAVAIPEKDDRLNKTPPPADRRSPTSHRFDVERPPIHEDDRGIRDENTRIPADRKRIRHEERMRGEERERVREDDRNHDEERRNRGETRNDRKPYSPRDEIREDPVKSHISPTRPRFDEEKPSVREDGPKIRDKDTRISDDRKRIQYEDRKRDDDFIRDKDRRIYDEERSDRRPQPPQDGFHEHHVEHHVNDGRFERPSSIRPPKEDHQPVRGPDTFYPAKDENDRRSEMPRKPIPPPRNFDRSNDASLKAPIRFPETYELSVPQPKVPACGVKPYELFIAGGEESDAHEWPWMTAIFRRYPDSRPKTFLCGGSLINTKYVLTAAHCFINNYVLLPASSFVVRLGSHLLSSGEEYTVANLLIHPNHSGSDFFNDIALVRVASEVYVTDKIAPICLPPPSMIRESLVGKMATVSGWGDTAFRSNGARVLQHVTVPIVSGDDCFNAYSRVRGAAFLARGSEHVICAGLREGGKDACLGDSGGPLMMKMSDDRWVIVGIVSLGYKCAEPGYPGVYTRVTHYLPWIETNMKRR